MFSLSAKWPRQLGLLLILLSANAFAVSPDETGELPIRLVGGHLVALVDVSTENAYEEWALLVDFEAPHTLGLVFNAMERLHLEDADAQVSLQFASGMTLKLPSSTLKYHGEPRFLDGITKFHIDDLSERQLVGSIGFELLKQYKVTIDADRGVMLLEQPQAPEQGLQSLEADLIVSPIREELSQTYLPIRFANGQRGEMVFGSTYHDTYINADLAQKMAAPVGDVGPVTLVGEVENTELDLARYMAFRPHKFYEEGADEASVALISGTNLLRHFRIVLDWENKYAAFTQTRSADFPKQDFAYFNAQHINTAQAMADYLDKYPNTRFSKEAAAQLVDLRVAENASDEELYHAVTCAIQNTEEMRRTGTALDYIIELGKLKGNRVEMLQRIGQLGFAYSNQALDGFSVYDIHVQLGLIAQDNGELEKAWEHLLSATFGRPDDFRAVLALGKVYEAQGRYRRAYSRYKKVATYVPLEKEFTEFLPRPVLQACINEAKKSMRRVEGKVPERDR